MAAAEWSSSAAAMLADTHCSMHTTPDALHVRRAAHRCTGLGTSSLCIPCRRGPHGRPAGATWVGRAGWGGPPPRQTCFNGARAAAQGYPLGFGLPPRGKGTPGRCPTSHVALTKPAPWISFSLDCPPRPPLLPAAPRLGTHQDAGAEVAGLIRLAPALCPPQLHWRVVTERWVPLLTRAGGRVVGCPQCAKGHLM